MGTLPAPTTPSHALLLLSLLLPLNCFRLAAGNNAPTGDITPPPHELRAGQAAPAFRPSMVIVVAVLTTLFSVTFLLLLYVKHCRNVRDPALDRVVSYSNSAYERKNSGIDRTVVESLPVFRFGSLSGQKEGLECAVCLNAFQTSEVLRLLPKCKHAFHVECVDTWLDAHSTCPLCRYRVDAEDVLLIIDQLYSHQSRTGKPNEIGCEVERPSRTRRVSGRHSFAGSRERENGTAPFSLRMSLDGFAWRKKTAAAGGEPVSVGCFERYQRKDVSLVTKSDGNREEEEEEEAEAAGRGERSILEHRISVVGPRQRWSDALPSDLLCVSSEMLMMNPSSLLGASTKKVQAVTESAINGRSVSEITRMGRFSASSGRDGRSSEGASGEQGEVERRVGMVARWLGWASQRMPAGQSLA